MTHVFVSGNLALDLAGTLKWRDTAPEELLGRPVDLDEWLQQARLLERPQATTADLVAARDLREAVFTLATARRRGEAFDPTALGLVNQVAAQAPLRDELTPQGLVRRGSVAEVFSTLARTAIEVLDPAYPAPIRRCAGARCTRLFVDRSRGGRRTWCGMSECGNRAKVANHRARRRAGNEAPAGAEIDGWSASACRSIRPNNGGHP